MVSAEGTVIWKEIVHLTQKILSLYAAEFSYLKAWFAKQKGAIMASSVGAYVKLILFRKLVWQCHE